VILAIESSCDDTCCAVVSDNGEILSNVISSQEAHSRYGGVVPEIASRHHLTQINSVISLALKRADVDLNSISKVAVTRGPGLVGALLVGLQTAKSIAYVKKIPLVAVDHIQGHIAACLLEPEPCELPFICLVASGGHTLLFKVTEDSGVELLGQTLDDAAGEAFDKGARLLGLGYPGGPALSKLAENGNPEAFDFPRSDGVSDLNFSFSGVKTALLYQLQKFDVQEIESVKADLAASYQAAVVDSLVIRVKRAVEATGIKRVAIGGGVAANSRLRDQLKDSGLELSIPAANLCTDNAAMIGSAARFLSGYDYPEYLDLDVYSTGSKYDLDNRKLVTSI